MKTNTTLNYWFLIPSCIILLVGGTLWLILPQGEEIFLLNQLRTEPYNQIFRFVTLAGEWYLWTVLILIALLRSVRSGTVFFISAISILCITLFSKHMFQQQRPLSWAAEVHPNRELVLVPDIYINKARTSFPSGHTCSAFAVCFLISQFLPVHRRTWGLAFWLVAAGVGFSRIFLVQHFLIDVVAGALLGILLGWLTWLAYACWQPLSRTKEG